MSALIKRSRTEPDVAKREDLTETSVWRGLLGQPAFILSALGLLIPIVLWVFVLPRHVDKFMAEVYGNRVWNGPNWTLYLYLGMAVGLGLGIAGIFVAIGTPKHRDTSKPRFGPLHASVAFAAMLFINALLFWGSFFILP